MRCFIAIHCPGDVKDRLVGVQREALGCGSMKAVEYENIHLTLKFLGDVEEGRLGEVKAALGSVEHPPFKAAVTGVGVFPSANYVRVFWAGVGEGAEEVVRLHSKVEAALKPMGFKRDDKFHPHITLARVRDMSDKARLKRLLDSQAGVEYGSYTVGAFTLMESRLTPNGPIYARILELPLR